MKNIDNVIYQKKKKNSQGTEGNNTYSKGIYKEDWEDVIGIPN